MKVGFECNDAAGEQERMMRRSAQFSLRFTDIHLCCRGRAAIDCANLPFSGVDGSSPHVVICKNSTFICKRHNDFPDLDRCRDSSPIDITSFQSKSKRNPFDSFRSLDSLTLFGVFLRFFPWVTLCTTFSMDN